MAMFFNEKLLKCIKCGNTAFIKEDVCQFDKTKKYVPEKLYEQLRCAQCGEIKKPCVLD